MNGKPEEIVSILKEEISQYEQKTQVSETGSVVQVGDGIATVYGLENVMYGELLEFENGVRALAMKMALSSRLAAENLLVVKGIELPEAKTKHFAKVAGTLGLNKALIVTAEESEALTRSARNIPGITLDRLSVLEILRHKQLVLLEGAVAPVQARFEK